MDQRVGVAADSIGLLSDFRTESVQPLCDPKAFIDCKHPLSIAKLASSVREHLLAIFCCNFSLQFGFQNTSAHNARFHIKAEKEAAAHTF